MLHGKVCGLWFVVCGCFQLADFIENSNGYELLR